MPKEKRQRKISDKPEAILWKELRKSDQLGTEFKKKYLLDSFLLDFYCPEHKLALEITGGTEYFQDDEYDRQRDELFKEKGIFFQTYTKEQVENDMEHVIKHLQDALKSLSEIKKEVPKI